MTPQLSSTWLAFGFPGGWEWIVLLVLGLLIFGRRLPEVGRSIGRSIVEFKRGIKGIEDEIEQESTRRPSARLEDQPPRRPEIPEARVSGEKQNPYAAVEEEGKD
jgi:sec-independent protein translocase protein TatA